MDCCFHGVLPVLAQRPGAGRLGNVLADEVLANLWNIGYGVGRVPSVREFADLRVGKGLQRAAISDAPWRKCAELCRIRARETVPVRTA